MGVKGVREQLKAANAAVDAISVDQAKAAIDRPDSLFVDVRETVERSKTGGLPGSIHVPRGFLEFMADPQSPSHKPELSSGKRLIIYCASGGRSALAAKTLQDMGIGNIVNLTGGINAWTEAGGPLEPAD